MCGTRYQDSIQIPEFDDDMEALGLVAEPASPAKAGAGCLSGPAGLGSKIYGITFLRITCNL